MDKHAMPRLRDLQRESFRQSGNFRLEDDGKPAIGHAVAFPQALDPVFTLRRETEGDYVLPARRRD